MDSSDLQIRWAEQDEVEQIVELLANMHRSPSAQQRRREYLRKYFRHNFQANPYLAGGQLRVVAAESNGRLVGIRPCMPCQLMVKGTPYMCDWGVSFAVDPKMRGAGIGTRLASAWAERCTTIAAIDSGPASQHIYRKLGFTMIAGVRTAVKVLRPLRAVRDAHDFSTRAGVLGGAFVGAGALFSGRLNSSVVVDSTSDLASQAGPFLPRLCAEYEWIAARTPEVLAWRFGPDAPHSYHSYIAKGNGEVTGYVVVRSGSRRRGVRTGVITDILASPYDVATYRALTRGAIKHFRDTGDAAAVVCRASHPVLLRALKMEGFVIGPRVDSFMFHTTDPDLRSVPVSPASRWHISFGGSDAEFADPMDDTMASQSSTTGSEGHGGGK